MLAALQRKGLSARTASHCRAVLRTALHDGEKWGEVARNAAKLADPQRVPRPTPLTLPPAEVHRVLDAARTTSVDNLVTPRSTRACDRVNCSACDGLTSTSEADSTRSAPVCSVSAASLPWSSESHQTAVERCACLARQSTRSTRSASVSSSRNSQPVRTGARPSTSCVSLTLRAGRLWARRSRINCSERSATPDSSVCGSTTFATYSGRSCSVPASIWRPCRTLLGTRASRSRRQRTAGILPSLRDGAVARLEKLFATWRLGVSGSSGPIPRRDLSGAPPA